MLKLINLGKSFAGRTVVRNLTLEIIEGELLCLLGPSGCGKTTTLRMIAGLEAPDTGEIYIEGRRAAANGRNILHPSQRNIGVVFQDLALWPHLTVEGNLRFILDSPKISGAEKEVRIARALELANLIEHRKAYPGTLSGGEQQRTAIARAIVAQPKLLLFDEPLASLDPHLKSDLRQQIKRLHKTLKTTIIYITHDQGEAFELATRIAVMKDGSVEQVGSSEQIYYQPSSVFVARFVGDANILEGKIIQNAACSNSPSQFLAQTPIGMFPLKGPQLAQIEEAVFVIRPEDVCIDPNSEIEAEVEESIFLGGQTVCRARIGEINLRFYSKSSLQGKVRLRVQNVICVGGRVEK